MEAACIVPACTMGKGGRMSCQCRWLAQRQAAVGGTCAVLCCAVLQLCCAVPWWQVPVLCGAVLRLVIPVLRPMVRVLRPVVRVLRPVVLVLWLMVPVLQANGAGTAASGACALVLCRDGMSGVDEWHWRVALGLPTVSSGS